MIEFKKLTLEDKPLYEKYLFGDKERGCEYSFANLYLWGRQSAALFEGNILLFSQFDRKSLYPFPVGQGDKKGALDAIIADAKERGIPCRISGIHEEDRKLLEELYPNKFRFHCSRDSYDYVYAIDDLADLKGKKYHKKRNHFYRFQDSFPNYYLQIINEENIEKIKEMAEKWYEVKTAENPDIDYLMEKAALFKALRDYKELGLIGLAIFQGEKVLAFTMGSFLSADTVDVHFEKAHWEAEIAYTAINYQFARYVRANFPNIKFLNREEDMGLEGLRKAKESYYPHHMVEECWACLLEEGYDY